MVYRLSFSFARFNDPVLNTKAQTIISCMTGNENFPPPVPQLTAMTATATAYNEALLAAQSRDLTKVSVKKQKKLELIDALNDLALYVMLTAKGDRTILLSSGFDLTKTPEPAPPVPQVSDLYLTDGKNPGELQANLAGKVTGARSYVFEYTTDISSNAPNWISRSNTAISYTFTNLQIGQRYYCRVAAVGSYGQMVYSNIVSRIVQ